MAVTLTGDKKLDKVLIRLTGVTSRKAAIAGVRAMMTPIAQEMRKGVTRSGVSVDLRRPARKTIKAKLTKSKFGTTKGTVQSAKVGFGVGKQKIPPRSGNNTGGVGVSANDIHWFVLGAGPRWLKKGSRNGPKTGHRTGSIAPVFKGIAAAALASSKAKSIAAAMRAIWKVMRKEAAKR